jgi:hypothetical protein
VGYRSRLIPAGSRPAFALPIAGLKWLAGAACCIHKAAKFGHERVVIKGSSRVPTGRPSKTRSVACSGEAAFVGSNWELGRERTGGQTPASRTMAIHDILVAHGLNYIYSAFS